MSTGPNYPTRDAPYVTPATVNQATVDAHDAAGMILWLHERASNTAEFLALTDDQQRNQFLERWQRNVLPHLAFRFKQAAFLIERLEADVSSWKGVAHDHSERLKVIGAERDRMRAMLRKLAGECAECHGRGYTFSDDGITGFGPDDREPTREACAECADIREAIEGEAPTYQSRVAFWMLRCFGEEIAGDRVERNFRFLEEAAELVQSLGCTWEAARQIIDYVFARDVGEPAQEVGGVSVTLAALCSANALDLNECAESELTRVWTCIAKIRAKQAAKPRFTR